MENSSRKKNVIKNMFVGTLFQLISLLMGFVNRTFFIKLLNEEYLGVNSLFTNILTILSFAELGIGNAIVFNLYKPLAQNDEEQVTLLMKFYRDTYSLIGIVILIAGLILVPFLPYLIESMPNIKENIYLIYILFLLDTVVSYFFTYRTAIIQADQKNYVIVRTVQTFKLILIFVQIIQLYLTHNYYLYVTLQLLNTIITYNYLAYKSKKMYPYTIKMPKESLPKKQQRSIFRNVKALFVNKIGSVILNGTDSIIISRYLGLAVLGLYSNYYLIINAMAQLLSQVFNAFTASIGNLIALDDKAKSKKIFDQLFYFVTFVYCVISICLYLLFNDFITIWIGEKYLLSNIVVFAIVLHFYINGTQFAAYTFRQTSGLFMQYRWSPILASFLNIFLSIFLAKHIGLSGVFFATTIARLSSGGWIDAFVLYREVFKEKVLPYYEKYYIRALKVLLIGVVCYYLTRWLVVENVLDFIVRGFLIAILSTLLFITTTFYEHEFKELKNVALNYLRKKRNA